MNERIEAMKKAARAGVWGIAGASFGLSLVVAGVVGIATSGIPFIRLLWSVGLVLIGAGVASVGTLAILAAREGVTAISAGGPEDSGGFD